MWRDSGNIIMQFYSLNEVRNYPTKYVFKESSSRYVALSIVCVLLMTISGLIYFYPPNFHNGLISEFIRYLPFLFLLLLYILAIALYVKVKLLPYSFRD
jgi:hypothetical protein